MRSTTPPELAIWSSAFSETTVRKGRGPFARLRRVTVGRRTLILRTDFIKLDRELERAAVALTGEQITQSKH